ncbi:MAG: hypothetical protein BMS9Abin07_1952 [Acidimicrobiia bacterium]|nr:MAG: hypothetical protein BMS9Abin07_1952 [Acidimicrobiia bacterium]
MGLGASLKVIGAGIAWRTAGSAAAGDTLLEAVSGDGEQERTLAAMSMVKAGERSIALIERARASGRLTPTVVRLLADIGGARSRALLTEIAAEPGPLAEAAVGSLDLLDRMEAMDTTD